MTLQNIDTARCRFAVRVTSVAMLGMVVAGCTQTAAPPPEPATVVAAPPSTPQPRVTAAGPKDAVADRSPEAIAQVQRIPGGL